MVGLQNQRFGNIRKYQSYDAIVTNSNGDVDELYNLLIQNDFRVYKFTEVPAILQGENDKSAFATIRSFDFNDVAGLPYEVYAGSFRKGGLIVSYNTAVINQLYLNQSINITILKKGETIPVVAKNVQSDIKGVYSTPVSSFNNNYFLMDRAQLLNIAPNTETKLAVYGDLGKISNIVGDMGTVSTWMDQNASLYAAMKLEQALMYVTLSIMSIIVLVNLSSSSKNLLELKRGEIAMLSVMGMKRSDIIKIFTNQALVISTVGVLSGSLLSYFFLINAPDMIVFLNKITAGTVAIFSVPLKLSFSILNTLEIAIPILLLTAIISYMGSSKILKNDGMEILINE
jgi:lipoprotein-releasing system permease protein